MCGVYGTTDPLVNIRDTMLLTKYRGPDGDGTFKDDHLTLGHNLLSITEDPALSAQPWRTPRGNLLVYNGEVFNCEDLEQKYQLRNKTSCDTEILAWGLDNLGLDFLDEIDSMHGFAYYRPREKELWLSRDHAGIKPMHYCLVKNHVYFSSELVNVIHMSGIRKKLNQDAINCINHCGMNILDETIWSDVYKVMPGETLVFDLVSKKIKHKKRIAIPAGTQQNFCKEEFRDMVSKTVKQTIMGRRKIGVFLSGGFDSGIIAAEAGKFMELETYTNRISPNIHGFNIDADCAAEMANKFGFRHREIVVDQKTVIDNWFDSLKYNEELSVNMSNVMYLYSNKFIANDGVTVTLAGDMGDELLGGYPKYLNHAKKNMKNFKNMIDVWADRMGKNYKIPCKSSMNKQDLLDKIKSLYPEQLWNPEDPIGSLMAFECVTLCPEEFFKRNDRFGMAFSLEGRFPFASKMFMQYCLSMPSWNKLDSATEETKLMPKTAYNEILPRSFYTKSKTGWTLPMGHWLCHDSQSTLLNFIREVYPDLMLRKGMFGNKTLKRTASELIVHGWLKYHQ